MNRFLLGFMLLCSFSAIGQTKKLPISISLYNESTAIPFTRLFTTPIHPGVQLGTSHTYLQKKHARLFQTANLHYFYHNHLSQGAGLYTELGYEYRLNMGLALSGLLGVGYLHTFSTKEEFTLVNGQYEKKADRGNARIFPTFSIDLGYYLQKEKNNSPNVFLRYQSWVEYPYSPDFIPLMTHINFHIGTTFFITTAKNKHD